MSSAALPRRRRPLRRRRATAPSSPAPSHRHRRPPPAPSVPFRASRDDAGRIGAARWGSRIAATHRKRDRERRAGAGPVALGANVPAMQLDDLVRDGEAEAEAAVLARHRAVRLPEAIEHVGQERRARCRCRVSRTTIENAVVDSVSSTSTCPPPARTSPRSRAGSRRPAAGDRRRRSPPWAARPAASRSRCACAFAAGRIDFDRRLDDADQVDDLALEMELAADDARDVEQVFDEPRLRAGIAVDAFERAPRLFGTGAARSAGSAASREWR